ncbi:MAG TPA: phosphoribosyltransferase [Terriglobia bacterium]|nr:phosphoribosyltransferase [Terriglobia bacterium]
MFRDRSDAGRQLANALAGYKGLPVVILALPRGGVEIGAQVAQFLNAPLDLVVVRKIGHPDSPEYAIGAVAEDGFVLTNPDEAAHVDPEWLREAASYEWNETQRRKRVFLGERRRVSVKDKIAIIVDDGLATGLTMEAAIHDVRKRHPQKIVAAVPVAALDTAAKIGRQVDDFIALLTPASFQAIGAYYEDFAQVTDEEVIDRMKVAPSSPMKTA